MGDKTKFIPEGVKGRPSTDANWTLRAPTIEGAKMFEVKNVPTRNGVTVECYRRDWGLHAAEVRHVIAVTQHAKAVSAWHRHRLQTDRFFPIRGEFRVALYDGRADSPSFRRVEAFLLSAARPHLLQVPPGVWHGIQNLDGAESVFLNYFDREYQYDDPDEYRLPQDTDEIPFKF